MSRLWTVNVTKYGVVHQFEEFGETVDEARETAAVRFGVPITKVASVLDADGAYISRPEVRP